MSQRYIVIEELQPPFFTEWMSEEMFPASDRPTIVIDLAEDKYSRDGIHWWDMEEDHL